MFLTGAISDYSTSLATFGVNDIFICPLDLIEMMTFSCGQINASNNFVGQEKQVQNPEVLLQKIRRHERVDRRRPRQQPQNGSRAA